MTSTVRRGGFAAVRGHRPVRRTMLQLRPGATTFVVRAAVVDVDTRGFAAMGEDRFGHYRLERPLGHGGTGQVWLAYDMSTYRTIALKVLPAEFAEDETYRRRFEQEARLAARLRSPHIVPIHTFGEIDGRLYVDMAFIEGTDVATMLGTDGPLTPVAAVDIIAQTAAALDVAHREGLIHRDVKPSNIIVDANGFAYLIDFGVAHRTGQAALTGTGPSIGTLAYTAPERFSGEADARSDIYALACVLYETLTGRRPYGDTDPADQMRAHLTVPPPLAADVNRAVPAALDDVIARGMDKDPDRRYVTADDFSRAAYAALSALADAEVTAVLPILPASALPPSPDIGAPEAYSQVHGSAQGAARSDAVVYANSTAMEQYSGTHHSDPVGPREAWADDRPGSVSQGVEPGVGSVGGRQDWLDGPETFSNHGGEEGNPRSVNASRGGSPEVRSDADGAEANTRWRTRAQAGRQREERARQASKAKRKKMIQLSLVALVVLLAAAGGGAVWFWRQSTAPGSAAAGEAAPGAAGTPAPPPVPVTAVTPRTVTAKISVGAGPSDIAIDPLAHTAYVVNTGDKPDQGTVSVIDTRANRVTATIEIGSYPSGIALDPASHTAYVSWTPPSVPAQPGTDNVASVSGRVSVIDTQSNTVTATIGVGENPQGIALDPASHTAYVANRGSMVGDNSGSSVSVIDTRTNKVTATVKRLSYATDVGVDPQTRAAYVASYPGSAVSVIDTGTNAVTATLKLGKSTTDVVVDPKTSTAYLVGDGSLYVIDTRTNAITATVKVARPQHIAIDPQANTALITTNAQGRTSTPNGQVAEPVLVVDTATNTVAASIDAGPYPSGIAVDPQTHVAYITNYKEGTVTVLTPA
ncbi:serine/threonine-protein kinase [Nocardia sp. NPDC052566]|uniref:serine/threonine-protein kinase n=1 Tax=Nocardia sp. NPDC052566 TaxID=3364330 RepID=UPI0037CBBB43